MKTPSMAGDARPAHGEMHPSKVQQSTTKQPDCGLILGFKPVTRDSNGNIVKETVTSNTPSKVIASPPGKLGTPKFDFRFSTDDSRLSDEARKLMENVREDVARIKAQMILDRGEQQRKDREADQVQEGRKIAKPKGKAGRFSDAHMAEFKKMDSIAGHPSTFRAQPGRFKPADKSLKRKSSKACLDEEEPRSSPSKVPVGPIKRVKRSEGTDAPAGHAIPKKTAVPQARSTFRNSSLMTPTKASSARFASASPLKTTMIPSLKRSPASRLAAPRTPQTDFNPRIKKTLPSIGSLKSILRRRQPLFSNDPAKIAAGTHIATPAFDPDINMSNLPSATFGEELGQTPSPKKRVEFTPSTKSRYDLAQSPPSPSKLPASHVVPATSDVVYPTLPSINPEKEKPDTPTIRYVRDSTLARQTNPFSDILAVPHGITNKKRQRESNEHGKGDSGKAPKSASTITSRTSPFPNIPAVPHGIVNNKRQREDHEDEKSASGKTPKSAPTVLSRNSPLPDMPAVPHGIINKKRRREDDDDDNDWENIPPADEPTDEQRSAKRLKPSMLKIPPPVSPSPIKSRATTPGRLTGSRAGTPSTSAKKGILSLSRLNMLAKPRSRG
jgi:hypothetical protein